MNKIRIAKATVNGKTCTISPTSHSCLATNKQILLKDEIKQIKLRIEDNGY